MRGIFRKRRRAGQKSALTTSGSRSTPAASVAGADTERVGLIGLPLHSVELKMVPIGPKYELRLHGVNVAPGYCGRPDLTAGAFDEEGFCCIGDAGVFVDPDDPVQGLIFSGRVVEDFKLTTGTFVQVGALRADVIAATSPVVRNALVAGQDRPFIGLLAWPYLDACRRLIGDMEAKMEAVIRHPQVVARLKEACGPTTGRCATSPACGLREPC